jgi:hypothetical protein
MTICCIIIQEWYFRLRPLIFLTVKSDAASRRLNAIQVPVNKKLNETEICFHVFSGHFDVGLGCVLTLKDD